jgi:hypothetical protein
VKNLRRNIVSAFLQEAHVYQVWSLAHRLALGAVTEKNQAVEMDVSTSAKAANNRTKERQGLEEYVPKLTASELFMRRRRWQVSTNILHRQ